MSIKITKSLENIDPKQSVTFLDEFEKNETTSFSSHFINDNVIWNINNFLTEDKCDEIIYASDNNGFHDVSYGK